MHGLRPGIGSKNPCFISKASPEMHRDANRRSRHKGGGQESVYNRLFTTIDYCSFGYSGLASFRMGTSGSASFRKVKKSL
jgi:hypothetical protein